MFGDSHVHLSYLTPRGVDLESLFVDLHQDDVPFLLDIGTHADDLFPRAELVSNLIDTFAHEYNTFSTFPEFSHEHNTPSHDDALGKISQNNNALSLADFVQERVYFAAGIWPHASSIVNRESEIKTLASHIERYKKNGFGHCVPSKLIALGECGIDRHWNEKHFDEQKTPLPLESFLAAEEEFFEMHIALAQKENLPVIVHSRDAFEPTFACIKNAGYHRGIIHCFSYDKDEARAFLDLGWRISFSGSITYAKKKQLPEYEELARFIPDDRLLLETDAPYMVPGKYRGRVKVNTPAFIGETYAFVAHARGIREEALALLVEKNFRELFAL